MTPKEFIKTCDDNALAALLTEMANRGFGTTTLQTIKDHLNKTSYQEFAKLLAKSLNIDYDNIYNDDRLRKYIDDLSVDITIQFASIRTILFSGDLNLHWFRYIGSNLTTTRPFCLAMTDKDYFHECEIPALLAGEFSEFEQHHGRIDEDTELPIGLYAQTDVNNFKIYRGGYGCGHTISPVPETIVPEEIKRKLYDTEEYKVWKQINK